MQAQTWLSVLKYKFIVVGIFLIAAETAGAQVVCQYTMALMGSTIARWIGWKLKETPRTPSQNLKSSLKINTYHWIKKHCER